MALVLGTNCGFVTTAPTANPGGTTNAADNRSLALKDTSPSGDNVVTEIGFYVTGATEEANFEVGIYDHNVGDDNPENLLAGESRTNAKGTDAGWKVVTGLNIPISADTIYWLSYQLDDTGTTTFTTRDGTGDTEGKTVETLPDPWGTEDFGLTNLIAIYAKVEAVGGGSSTDNLSILGENIY